MNILSVGITNLVHFTEVELPADWETRGQSRNRTFCSARQVNGHVLPLGWRGKEVNCPKCLAKA